MMQALLAIKVETNCLPGARIKGGKAKVGSRETNFSAPNYVVSVESK